MLVGGRLKAIAARKAELARAADLDRLALRVEAGSIRDSVAALGRVTGWLRASLGLWDILADLRGDRNGRRG